MIDMHSHIVFGVDDGAKDIEQSMEMIKEASEAGFNKIVVTPHYIKGSYEKNKEDILKRIEMIKQNLQDTDYDIEILQGNEIYIDNDINKLLDNEQAVAINDKKYVLFELPLNSNILNLTEIVYQILEKERIPILAHPERYPFVQKDPNVLIPLIEDGVLMQSNYGSILGQYGEKSQKTLKKMLEHNMVHLLSSDVHRPKTIYPRIQEAIKEIKKIVGEEEIKNLTSIYLEYIVEGEKIETPRAIPIKKNIFSKLFY